MSSLPARAEGGRRGVSRFVRDVGTGQEPIIVIGESPGQYEEIQGRPFVGPSGAKLASWLREVGLSRQDCYWTNVYPYRPPNNRIEEVSDADVAPWIDDLHVRLARLHAPVVIVPTGNVALRALTGKSGITKHRGSIYAYRDQRGRIIKVIPTIHPAASFRQPAWERRCVADWQRIAEDHQFTELRLPIREHLTRPTLADCADYLADARERASILACDIETPRETTWAQTVTKRGKVRQRRILGDARITCVGFSFEPHCSLTIPTTEAYWQNESDLAEAWDIIRQLCALPCEKALQNGLFDTWWLAQYGIDFPNWRWDTRWMSHALDPLDSHDLAYQASRYTREPYWKDEAKDPDEASKYTSDMDAFWTYNGKDVAVTRELVDVHAKRFADAGAWAFYDRHYAQMFGPLLDLSLHGIRVNERDRKRRFAQFTVECIRIQDRLAELTGETLYGAKDLSTVKLAKYLYDRLGLPRQHNRATGAVTTREVAVRQLALRYPKKLGAPDDPDSLCGLILTHRRQYKLGTFVKEGVADADGRMRSSFGFVSTGRLSSSKNPRRTGANSQNTDRELLDIFVPDEGCIFIEADLSQAESRVVRMLTRSPRLIAQARMPPWEYDEHKRAASLIFGVAPGAVTKDQRYLGKRARHAGNYGMRGRKLSEELLKDGYVLTPIECDRYINQIIDQDTPEVRDWQRETRQLVLRHRMLANSWGRTWDFTCERLSDDLFREAYACIPQSEVVDLLNRWGFVPLWRDLRDRGIPARINNQKHDSLLVSTPPEWAWDIACFLKASLERPRTYLGESLVIPIGITLGRTAAGDHEFKRFPSRRQFDEAAYSLAGGDGKT